MKKPDRYAVLGNPIAHSLSPEIHRSFARSLGESIVYEKLEVPIGGFSDFVDSLIEQGYKGCNITLPFKMEAYKYAERLTVRARGCGAANTLIFGSRVTGDNTDGAGFVADVTGRFGFPIEGSSILVLGAGGGVRGLLPSLLELNPKWIAVANRTMERAEALASSFGIDAIAYEETAAEHFDLIINATSTSLSNLAPPVPKAAFAEASLAYDLVYAARPTPFMELALKSGARKAVDGLGMLIEQAAESYADWRGVRPDTASTYGEIRCLLENRAASAAAARP
ncbi:shikimate dehydrogenase [Mesosutterella sp. AGMB02718]|uniref:Shikimate dehydrogenase (NADP(+)) n=1 Tax=Mesosutterella faecium TaxID=2925194 RepID=A0ABT7IJQ4_9BURK|nr:shikimate dehydrogenase [Mesosutterella sp. AGMB02718]MDL2058597.1 shikimate dehydrogenase [Mesosutterella sp. AGMB02718]